MLHNTPWLINFRFDTAENELSEVEVLAILAIADE